MTTYRFVGFALGAAWALLATPVAAGVAGTVKTLVEPLAPSVSYSREASGRQPAMIAYLGYGVTVVNQGGNTANNVRFTGRVALSDPDALATFHAPTEVCVAAVADGGIECALGQLRAGQQVSFQVFFRMPYGPALTPPDPNLARFGGTTFYAEGGGGPTQVWNNSTDPWPPVDVSIGAPSTTSVASALPPGGGTFFTGSGLSLADDVFATVITVPPSSARKASIQETPSNAGNCNNFLVCFESEITIPDGFFTQAPLRVVLRIDGSNVKPGTRAEHVLVTYEGVLLGDCATSPMPCIDRRIHYRNRQVEGWTPELDRDIELHLLNDSNGSYRVF